MDTSAVEKPTHNVAPSPHVVSGVLTTQRMMKDVLIALSLPILFALWNFGWWTLFQILVCGGSAVLAEYGFERMRGRQADLKNLSALLTGVLLAMSLPWSSPWYVGVIASGVAIGIGKVVFGGLGQNMFNPAMVGRAFVMISFPAAIGASAYVQKGVDVVSAATPLTAAKQSGVDPSLWPLLIGDVNGSLGEVSAIACLIGGIYLCVRRTASWEIPAGVLGSAAVFGLLGDLILPDPVNFIEQLSAGAMIFGAFFIATDPVTSPLTPKGKLVFGVGIGAFVMLLRGFSGYPEGMMFAVLLMNALVPLINRWMIPTPVGGPVPVRKS